MTAADKYRTPEAFKVALEVRVRRYAAVDGVDINRFRQLLVFDRFLARIGQAFGDRALLKGGVVLELRLDRARATRDIDLRVVGDPGQMLEQLQLAGRLDLGDHLSFLVTKDAANIEGDGVVYEGQRFRAEARLGGMIYGRPFGVDVAFGDPLVGDIEEHSSRAYLDFVGIPATRLRLYPRETHVAEKLHAYTLPRRAENSRVKDLPDLALLAQTGPFTAQQLRTALRTTFTFRGSHPLPALIPAPPASWLEPYAKIAAQNRLPWPTLPAVERAVREFLDPLLASTPVTGAWSPEAWAWHAPRS